MDSWAPAPLANNQCRSFEHLFQIESAPFKELQRAVITAEDVCTIFQAISAQQSTPKKQQDTFSDLLLNLEWSCLEEYFFHTAKSTFHMFCWIWYFCDMFALVDTCSMSANFLVCLEKKCWHCHLFVCNQVWCSFISSVIWTLCEHPWRSHINT